MQVVIDYVADKAREFGDKGAAVKMMLQGGGEAEFATGRAVVDQHIEALKKLVGQTIEVEGEQTQYGFKVKKYPGMPSGGGGGRGGRGSGDWETAPERAFREQRVAAISSVKYALAASEGMEPTSRITFIQEHAPALFDLITSLVPPLAVVEAKAPSSNGSNRIQDIIQASGGDARAVVRAKRYLTATKQVADFDMLAAEEWEQWLADFVVQDA